MYPKTVNKKPINIPQPSFPKGYVSTLYDSRTPIDALTDMTNMTLEQDSVPRPRPPFVAYGNAFLGTCIGIGKFTKMVSGKPQYWEISMQVIAGVATICIRKDGGSWSTVSSGVTYDTSAWCQFTQGAAINNDGSISNRVYITNGKTNMSYYLIDSGTVTQYTSISAPTGLTVTPTGSGMTGTNYTYYVRVTAVNAGGESAATSSVSQAVALTRNSWSTTNYLTYSWAAVSGALYYNVYVGFVSGQEQYLTTVNGTSFLDNGTTAQNPFKLVPTNNSSAGPLVAMLCNMDNQLFGWLDTNNPQYLWYSGQAQHFGDWSFNPQGGGYVGIDYGGSTVPLHARAFHDGHGNPVLTVLCRGPAGYGKLYHVTFTTTTIGTTQITYPNVYEGNANDGTISAWGVAEYNNALYYCTGQAFKTTGTKADVINILATDTISNQIIPDIQQLNLSAMGGSRALEFQGQIYFALPFGGNTYNSEIWVLDLTRGGLWKLRWQIAGSAGYGVSHMWLYEDNNGKAHFCILVNNQVLELDYLRQSTPTQDNGIPFSTRVASGALVFDHVGVTMAYSYITRFKFLYPLGTIAINLYGITDASVESATIGGTSFMSIPARVGWSNTMFSDPTSSGMMSWTDPAAIPSSYGQQTSQAVSVQAIEVDSLVNQQKWEILTSAADCDYLLAGSHFSGYSVPNLYLGD